MSSQKNPNMNRAFFFTLYTLCLFTDSFALAGPKLTVLNITETEIHVEWSPISNPSLHVQKYQVSAYPLKTYGQMNMINRNEWTYYNSTTKSELIGLHPGTLYNLSIMAYTDRGLTESSSQRTWTEVGSPDVPPGVEIVERKGKTMVVNLPSGSSDKGPITSYQVVIIEKSPIMYLTPEELGDFARSQQDGLPFYITADLTPEEANQSFVVGNAKMYGGYYNAPLLEDRDYEVLVGVVSSLNGVSKISYSSLKSSESSHQMAHNNPEVRTSSTLSVALSAAIGVFGFLLVMSVIAYILLRKKYGRRRPSDELVLRVHGSEGEENGFIPGMLHLDDETDLSEFYDQLKEHYGQIPRSHIEVHQAVLGIGQFGEVREGVVQRHPESIPCLVQHTQAPSAVTEKEKRGLLQELDKMARIGCHPNVVEFLGACDEHGILLVAVEHHSSSLRGMLLRSRQQQNGKITLSEGVILRICAGVAQGMAHLSERGIVHKHLSSRNVLMDGKSTPKIAHFGMGHYYPLGKKLLYTRWSAPETLNSNMSTSKSDVWSFGVLLYEIFTLGSSPYAHVPIRDLLPRLTQGMRLPKPKGISDELYQVMLQCWEIDPDERPTFAELSTTLQNMLPCAQDHINLQDLMDGNYAKFDPNAEDD